MRRKSANEPTAEQIHAYLDELKTVSQKHGLSIFATGSNSTIGVGLFGELEDFWFSDAKFYPPEQIAR